MSVAVVDAGPQQISRSVEVQAPAAELFAIVADPTRHHEVDGSGTVRGNIRAPAKFGVGARFSTRMRMYGMPYRITSTVTALVADKLIEWRHPVGHRWRWEFEALSPTCTRVTETFDYRDTGRGEGRAQVLRARGFRQTQRGRDRGNPVQAARSVRVALVVDGYRVLDSVRLYFGALSPQIDTGI